jgi:hypothetical protein
MQRIAQRAVQCAGPEQDVKLLVNGFMGSSKTK